MSGTPTDPGLLVAFVLTTAVAMMVPGPDMLFILGCGLRAAGCGLRGGPRAGLWATCGVASSEAIHVLLAAVGLTALFAAVPAAFTAVRLVGAVYLVYLGVRALRTRSRLDLDADAPGMTGGRAYASGLLTNLLNPKMVLFTVALLPQFVQPEWGHVWAQFAVLGAILVVFEFLVDGTVGVLAGRIGGWLRRRRKLQRGLDVTVGSIFIGLGVRLAVMR